MGAGLVRNNNRLVQTGRIAGTLLGPEATPRVVATVVVMVVLSLHLVVGCGVCLLDSGCEHLSKIADL